MDRLWWYLAETFKEFACFSFHVRLLVITLSSLKLHTENNACLLCASVSCWAHLFLQHLRRRSLWIICETNDQWTPASCEISLNVRWLWVCLSEAATVTQLCQRFHQYVHSVHVDCSELHQQPADAVFHPTFLQKLCYKLPSVVKFLYNHTDFKILSSLLNGIKIGEFAWSSIIIHLIFGVRFERQIVDKKQTYMKTETCKLYSRVFLFLPNII